MSVNPGLYSSASGEWETPQALFDKLNEEFHFTLDPAATYENRKCSRYFSKKMDGLRLPWSGRVFLNPPYGREIGKWVEKACEASKSNAEYVVCLLPARTDTRWWHDWVMRATEVRFIRGRVRFVGAKNAAPFPSCIVVFRRGHVGKPEFSTMELP